MTSGVSCSCAAAAHGENIEFLVSRRCNASAPLDGDAWEARAAQASAVQGDLAVARLTIEPHEKGHRVRIRSLPMPCSECTGPPDGASSHALEFVLALPRQPVPVLGGVISGSSIAVAACLLERWHDAQRDGKTLPRRAVELGAGRGLIGQALAHLGIQTLLTDLESAVCEALGASANLAEEAAARAQEVRHLDWDDGLDSLELATMPGGLLVGSELLWADDAVDALWDAVAPAVWECGWEFVYGASKRPSNKKFLRQVAGSTDTMLTTSTWLIQQICTECQGWRTLEECIVASWRSTREGNGG